MMSVCESERSRREQRRVSTEWNGVNTTMRQRILAAAIAAAFLFAGSEAFAGGIGKPCKGPFCNHHPDPWLSGVGHGGQTLPVFQAAPWYLYWPYDAHFLTAAPVGGAFYGPPIPNNFPVQPYFPYPQWMPPAGSPVVPVPAPTGPVAPVITP
jgi:hypothetical protein